MRKLVRTYVDADLMQQWNERHGDYAALSWLLETAIKSVLDLTKGQPTLTQSVKDGIEKKLLEIRSERTEHHATTT
jgi:hypothetical protein